jgi:putative flippase GtrA
MRKVLSHARQFVLYLVTGSTAVGVDAAGTWVLIHLHVYYVLASLIAGTVSFLLAFLLHKYIAFNATGNTAQQLVRYCILGVWNIIAQNLFLILFVEHFGMEPIHGKILAMAILVLWNFFFYRFFVYR